MFAKEALNGKSEAIGLFAAIIILLFAFGSVLAMGLPIGTALFGIGTGIAIVSIANNFIDMPDFTTAATAMIGLGVGIDYALFIVTRYRENLEGGLDPERSVVRAVDTAGRAVLFAGTTVVISILGLLLMQTSIYQGSAIGIAIGVLTTMLASVTLLPALLGFVGRNIDKFGVHRRKARTNTRESVWVRWSHVIQRRPWPALIVGLDHPPGARDPDALHALRPRRRRQPAGLRHDAPRVRPHGRGLRSGLQRPAAARGARRRTASRTSPRSPSSPTR